MGRLYIIRYDKIKYCKPPSPSGVQYHITIQHEYIHTHSPTHLLNQFLLLHPGLLPTFVQLSIHQPLILNIWRNPLTALPRLHLRDVHRVYLLQRPALGLADEEVDNQDGGKIAAGKDVPVFELDVAGDEGGEKGDEEVPGPVGGCDEGHGAGAVLAWEYWVRDLAGACFIFKLFHVPKRGKFEQRWIRKDTHVLQQCTK